MEYHTKKINYSLIFHDKMIGMIKMLKILLFVLPFTIPSNISSADFICFKNDRFGILSKSYKLGLDHRLVYAIIKTESNWNPNVKGDSGRSHGLMQVQCSTARGLRPLKKCSDLMQVGINLDYGMLYLKEQIRLYGKKDIKLAVAAYNSGRPIFKDRKLINQDYVSRVMRSYEEYKRADRSI